MLLRVSGEHQQRLGQKFRKHRMIQAVTAQDDRLDQAAKLLDKNAVSPVERLVCVQARRRMLKTSPYVVAKV